MDELVKTRSATSSTAPTSFAIWACSWTGSKTNIARRTLVPTERHRQQHGLIHAGVMATMADHTSGCAARGAVGLDRDVVSVEFKINFLRPAVADRLRCRGRVLRAGKMLVICEAEVFAEKDAEEKLVSKAMVTLAVKRRFLTCHPERSDRFVPNRLAQSKDPYLPGGLHLYWRLRPTQHERGRSRPHLSL